jgi:hypothetical protein
MCLQHTRQDGYTVAVKQCSQIKNTSCNAPGNHDLVNTLLRQTVINADSRDHTIVAPLQLNDVGFQESYYLACAGICRNQLVC